MDHNYLESLINFHHDPTPGNQEAGPCGDFLDAMLDQTLQDDDRLEQPMSSNFSAFIVPQPPGSYSNSCYPLALNGSAASIDRITSSRNSNITLSPMISATESCYDDDDLDSLLLTPMISPNATPSAAFQRLGIDVAGISPLLMPSQNAYTATSSRTTRYSPYQLDRRQNLPSAMEAASSNDDPDGDNRPMTPAQMMKISVTTGSGNGLSVTTEQQPPPKTVKPQTGSSILSEEASTKLAKRSNYENIQSGDLDNMGIAYSSHLKQGIEVRKTNHKIAEQKRRNSIKNCFEEIRSLLPNIRDKNPSRLYILQRTCEYLRQLHEANGGLLDGAVSDINSTSAASTDN